MFDWIGTFCHQLPGRSLQCAGETFPLCFRCSGTALGLFAGFVLLVLDRGGWKRRLPDLRPALWIAALTTPLFLDGWGNFLGLWSTPGWARAWTGTSLGVALPLLLVPLLQPLDLNGTRHLPPTLRSAGHLLWPLGFVLGWVSWLNLAPNPLLFRVSAALCAVGEAALTVVLALVVWRALAERFRRSLGPFRTPTAAEP